MDVSNLFRFCNSTVFRFKQITCFSFSWSLTNCNFSWYKFCFLSKDHAGNAMQTGAKMISYLKIKTFKNSSLSRGTHLYRPYKGGKILKKNSCSLPGKEKNSCTASPEEKIIMYTLCSQKRFCFNHKQPIPTCSLANLSSLHTSHASDPIKQS